MNNDSIDEIKFFAKKVYIHHWPPETSKWSDSRKSTIQQDINTNKEKKEIVIKKKQVQIDHYLFVQVRKIGLTIPQFKRQSNHGCGIQ